jgi:hypothetical protein
MVDCTGAVPKGDGIAGAPAMQLDRPEAVHRRTGVHGCLQRKKFIARVENRRVRSFWSADGLAPI